MTEKDPTRMAKSTPYWICCSCDAPLSCDACGIEQPNDNDEITRLTESCESYKAQVEAGAAEIARLTADLARAREALGEARDSIAIADKMLSEHIEEYHDFDYEPHQVPDELSSLRAIEHHLMGSLILEEDIAALPANPGKTEP